MRRKPTTSERLRLPTPHYFKRLAARSHKIGASCIAGAATMVGITSLVPGLEVNEHVQSWINGAAIGLLLLGVCVFNIAVPIVAKLVYDDKTE